MSNVSTGPSVHNLLNALRGVVSHGDNHWKAYCPIHENDGAGHDPSLDIKIGESGEPVCYCFVCQDARIEQFCHAAGVLKSDVIGQKFHQHGVNSTAKSRGKKTAEYPYHDAQGVLVYRVCRYENSSDGTKTFVQQRPNGKGGWIASVTGIEKVPYRLPELIAADKTKTVFIVEGEKKVDALVKWGQIATCNAGGAGKWNKEWSKRWFRGRDVVVLPDNDPIDPETGDSPGGKHARKVVESMQGIANSVRVIQLPGLPPKGDIVDWIDQGGTLPKLLELLAEPDGAGDGSAGDGTEKKTEGDSKEVNQLDPLDLRVKESLNDIGNGRRLVKLHGTDFRWCDPWGKWLVWDQRRWKVDNTNQVHRFAKSVSKSLWDEFGKLKKEDISEGMVKTIFSFVRGSSSMSSVERSLKAASSETESTISPESLDADPWLFNCLNGTVDLRTGEMKSHDQKDLLTKISPVEFDPEATCPHWESFLLSVFETQEMASYIQRLCGYWATGVIREQSLPILWGAGSNGKTTFLNAIMDVFGNDYAMKAPSDFLMAKQHEGHPTEKADLFGKRFVVCSETEDGRRLNESMVKELTGDEPIRARRMREDFWQFNPSHKLVLVTNHLPQIRGNDHGMWRRIRRVSFGRCFWNPDLGETGPPELIQDKELKDKLQNEKKGILTWIVRGCIEWAQFGEQAPASVTDWTNEYKASQDVLGTFVEEMCWTSTVDAGCTCGATDLYKVYKKWADSNGEYGLSRRKFSQSMSERGFTTFKNNNTFYQGIALSPDFE